MLKKSIVRCAASACVALGLAATACDSSGSSSTTNANANSTPAAKDGGSKPAGSSKTTDKLADDAPMKDVLAGRWVADDVDTFSWHFAADNFVVTSTDETDLTQFPKGMRNKVKSFYGFWKLTDSEIVLTKISGPGQSLIEEIRIPYKRISNQKFEIDGKTFTRNAIQPSETPAEDHA